jgi:hypothetical protein
MLTRVGSEQIVRGRHQDPYEPQSEAAKHGDERVTVQVATEREELDVRFSYEVFNGTEDTIFVFDVGSRRDGSAWVPDPDWHYAIVEGDVVTIQRLVHLNQGLHGSEVPWARELGAGERASGDVLVPYPVSEREYAWRFWSGTQRVGVHWARFQVG